ncbi:MAG: hypothetical protein WC299_11475 [Kiritimatiellia bacterium]
MALASAVNAADKYVVKNNPGAVFPYESWTTAAGDIQTAVDAALEGEPVMVRSSARWPFLAQRSYRSPGETVWVRAGVYDSGGKPDGSWRSKLTNRVAISKAIIVRSENNDPVNTIIKGAWSSDGRTNGPGAVRCVSMADGSALIGFTLTGGATLTTNEEYASSADRSGGGVWARSSLASISNCIITGNSAFGDPRGTTRGGGGVCGGKYFNCVLKDNTTPLHGGGADHAVLFNTMIAGNSAGGNGGGIKSCELQGGVVSNNSAVGQGGGAYGGSLDDCELVGNRSGHHGGGAAVSDGDGWIVLSGCVVAGNHSDRVGGGVRFACLFNCLISSNTAASGGQGAYQSSASNTLFHGNDFLRGFDCHNSLFVQSAAEGMGNMHNCSFVGSRGSGFAAYPGKTCELFRCVSWSNSRPDSGAIIAYNSCGAGGPYTNAALGNTTNNPMFVDYAAGDYRLRDDSPCRGAGFNPGKIIFSRSGSAQRLEEIKSENRNEQ